MMMWIGNAAARVGKQLLPGLPTVVQMYAQVQGGGGGGGGGPNCCFLTNNTDAALHWARLCEYKNAT